MSQFSLSAQLELEKIKKIEGTHSTSSNRVEMEKRFT